MIQTISIISISSSSSISSSQSHCIGIMIQTISIISISSSSSISSSQSNYGNDITTISIISSRSSNFCIGVLTRLSSAQRATPVQHLCGKGQAFRKHSNNIGGTLAEQQRNIEGAFSGHTCPALVWRGVGIQGTFK
jgi:hypothetical protein